MSEDVKLMPEKVLKVLRRYLLSFLSYRENTGALVKFTPPPALRGLSDLTLRDLTLSELNLSD